MDTLKTMLVLLLCTFLVACGPNVAHVVDNEAYRAEFYTTKCENEDMATAVMLMSGQKEVKAGKVKLKMREGKVLQFCYAEAAPGMAFIVDEEGDMGIVPLAEVDRTPKTGV